MGVTPLESSFGIGFCFLSAEEEVQYDDEGVSPENATSLTRWLTELATGMRRHTAAL